MAMVMPRARSSGALSIWSNGVKSANPLEAWRLVIAAVRVVLPWSTWPMVPTLTCGLLRSNFFFAMSLLLMGTDDGADFNGAARLRPVACVLFVLSIVQHGPWPRTDAGSGDWIRTSDSAGMNRVL